MTDRQEAIERLFQAAADLPDEERSRYLAARCGPWVGSPRLIQDPNRIFRVDDRVPRDRRIGNADSVARIRQRLSNAGSATRNNERMLQPLLWLLVAVLSISSSSWAGEDRCVTVQQFSIANSKAESFFIDGEHTTLELALTTASRGVIVEYRDGGQWYRLPASRVVSAEGIRISVRDIGEYHMEYEYADPCSGTVSRRVGIRGVFKIRK